MWRMLRAQKTSMWKRDYVITADGQEVTTFSPARWKTGGQFSLGGSEYTIRANVWGSKYGMTAADGAVVATADRVGRKRWNVEAGGELYRFQRESAWRPDQALMLGNKKVGTIKRASKWKGGAVAELPEMSVPVQVFVVAVVVTMWNKQAAAAGAGAAAAGG
jgi:hypothetical protein